MNDRNDKRMTMQLERAERPARTISANDRRSSLKCAKIFLIFKALGMNILLYKTWVSTFQYSRNQAKNTRMPRDHKIISHEMGAIAC